MPYVEISSFKAQEVNAKVAVKKEAKAINQKVKEAAPEKPKKLNPFKDIKFIKKPEVDELKVLKQELEMNKIIEDERGQQVEKTRSSDEGKLFDQHVNSLLSMTQKDPLKREIFARRLKNNKAIQSYVDENIIFNACNRLDRNVKFALHYALEYKETDREYQLLLLRHQHLQQQQPPPSHVEEIKEETKEEAPTE